MRINEDIVKILTSLPRLLKLILRTSRENSAKLIIYLPTNFIELITKVLQNFLEFFFKQETKIVNELIFPKRRLNLENS